MEEKQMCNNCTRYDKKNLICNYRHEPRAKEDWCYRWFAEEKDEEKQNGEKEN